MTFSSGASGIGLVQRRIETGRGRGRVLRCLSVLALAFILVGAVSTPASAHVGVFLGFGLPVYSYPYVYAYPPGYAYPPAPPPAYYPYLPPYAGYGPYVGYAPPVWVGGGHWGWRSGHWGYRAKAWAGPHRH